MRDFLSISPRDFFRQQLDLVGFGDSNYYPTGRMQPPHWLPGFNFAHPLARGCIQATGCWDWEAYSGGWIMRDATCNPYYGNSSMGPQPDQIESCELGRCALVNYKSGHQDVTANGISFSGGSYDKPYFDDFSISFWYKLDDPITCVDYTRAILWLRLGTGGTIADTDYYDIVIQDNSTSGTHVAFKMSSMISSVLTSYTDNYTWSYTKWNHICVTRTGNLFQIYVNGKVLSSHSLTGLTGQITTDYYQYGEDINVHAGFGKLICIHTFTRALTDGDVAVLMYDPWILETPPPEMVFEYANFGPNIFNQTPTGGVIANGNAAPSCICTVTPSGGALVGGSASVGGGQTYFPSGGALVGGTAFYEETETYRPTGGILAGGSSMLQYFANPTPTGGVRVGDPRFANGKRYREKIIVPAGKVSEDQLGYPIMVKVTVNPLSVESGFIFEQGGATVPSEIGRYDASTGRLKAYVKVDLLAASDNVIYVYY